MTSGPRMTQTSRASAFGQPADWLDPMRDPRPAERPGEAGPAPTAGPERMGDAPARDHARQADRHVRGDLNEALAGQVALELMSLDASGDEHVTLYVDSGGGNLEAAFTVIDVIDLLGVPVHATCLGRAEGPAVGSGRRLGPPFRRSAREIPPLRAGVEAHGQGHRHAAIRRPAATPARPVHRQARRGDGPSGRARGGRRVHAGASSMPARRSSTGSSTRSGLPPGTGRTPIETAARSASSHRDAHLSAYQEDRHAPSRDHARLRVWTKGSPRSLEGSPPAHVVTDPDVIDGLPLRPLQRRPCGRSRSRS